MSNLISHVSAIPAGPQAPNWFVEFSDAARAPVAPHDIEELCVATLDDGTRIVGTPKLSQHPGKFDVVGYAGYPDAISQSRVQVSRVNWIVPRKSARTCAALAA